MVALSLRIGLLASSLSRAGGGVFEALLSQAQMLVEMGHQPVLFGIVDEQSSCDADRLDRFEVKAVCGRGPKIFSFAPDLVTALTTAELDCLHLHGVWQYASFAGAHWAARTRKPYIISPHGMLDPWILARGRAKKAIASALYEKNNWSRASIFHALTVAEASDIARITGLNEAKIRIIPNAVDRPFTVRDSIGRKPQFLYLSRIHPKKNLDGLLRAWQIVSDEFPNHGFDLVICGWGEDAHVTEFKDLLANLQRPDILFKGPEFGASKQRLLHESYFVILPSLSEGLPMTILEAWAAGTPVLMSNACHLDEGFAANAAFETGTNPRSIASAIIKALHLSSSDWNTMSQNAAALVDKSFSRRAVTLQWEEIIRIVSRDG